MIPSPAEQSPGASERPPQVVLPSGLRASVLVGLCCLLVYNANWRAISAGDTYPARYLPFAICQYRTLFLNPIEDVTARGREATAFWMVHRPDGRIISLYPVVLPVLVSPLYLPAVAYLHLKGWTEGRLDRVARVMEKLVASLIAALSASLLYLLLRRRVRGRIALLLTLAYAFGTTTWGISSQALWQHGIAQLLVIGALLCLTATCTTQRAIAAGLLLGLLAGNRPPDAILAGVLGAYGLFWAAGRSRAAFVAAAALPMILVTSYNLYAAGNVVGGYWLIGRSEFFAHDLLTGIGALLVSPTRGLLVFSPFLCFLAFAWRHLPRGRAERGLTLAMAAGVALQIVLYAKADWRGGVSWGPRYMTDLLPMLVWMLAPVVASLRRLGMLCFIVAVAASVGIEGIGAFYYTGRSDAPLYAVKGPHEMEAAWYWRNAPFVASLTEGRAPAELTDEVRGTFDAIESGGRATTTITAGQPAVAVGWALAGHATPWQVAVSVDGGTAAGTRTFSKRPDLGLPDETSAAAWSIPIDTSSLAPGRHAVTAMVWVTERGDSHYLQRRDLTIVPAQANSTGDGQRGVGASGSPVAVDLAEDARNAASRIREHQQAAGYWRTAYTAGTAFRESRPEMNTFVTSLMVDLLDPVAAASGLQESVRHARSHLTAQIEPTGLVRYHGLPDGPGIGTLGCAITPDADDTALVWRIAPPRDRTRLAAALATIDRYRTGDGLYRTWLAPREAYQCIDPGGDPDPADLAVQMHLLLLLSEVRPAASQALCAAIRPAIDDDRVWVYYRKTPLIPILRLPDLARAGCELKLPESRMQTVVPGQETWGSVVRLLAQRGSEVSPHDTDQIEALLRRLAAGDFALLRSSPPLLYHNDLTASVSRFYWSVDVGYALWLRLYDRYERRPLAEG